MRMYQFRCEDCGILFEEVLEEEDSAVSCEFCNSHHVRKLFPVAPLAGSDEETLLEDEC